MNPLQAIPAAWRFALYVVYAVAGPVLIYTASRGWTGDSEYALYVGLGSALGLTAAANVRTRQRVTADIKVEPLDGQAIHAALERHAKVTGRHGKPDNKPTGYHSGV